MVAMDTKRRTRQSTDDGLRLVYILRLGHMLHFLVQLSYLGKIKALSKKGLSLLDKLL